MYVCMYVFADCAMQFYACVCISAMLAQYNPMLAYVCPSLCAMLRRSVAKMCPRGRLRPRTTVWPVWPVSCGIKNTTSISSPCPAHCALRMISVPPFTWPRETGLARSHGQLNRFLNRFKIAKTVAKPFYLNLLRSRFNVDRFC